MQKTLAVAIAVFITAVVLPTIQAGETIPEKYTVPAGCQDSAVRIACMPVLPKIESACGDCYTDFLTSIDDTLPADTFYVFCVITDHQDGRAGSDGYCGDIDPLDLTQTPDDIVDPVMETCGVSSLTAPVSSGGPTNVAVAWIYNLHTDMATGGTCLGSNGTFTTEMS